ncbi:MAG: pirin family protein [Siphonobacter aquaeclarae]|nr:pirin family protein [Siphonobacter aquaeclarae]
MALLPIRRIVRPQGRPLGPLTMYQPLPENGLDQIDPFLLLHHHGPQTFPAHNTGLPFGPHPHRGFETVTFIYEGDVQHRDSNGYESTIRGGGVQWMTAGSGLVHSETSSADFRRDGGPVELIQLWINLPARLKMTPPDYRGLQEDDIPIAAEGGASLAVVSGTWSGVAGPVASSTQLATLTLAPAGGYTREIPAGKSILFYVLNGSATVNGQAVQGRALVVFGEEGGTIEIRSDSGARILWGIADPIREPVVAHGPFVMNTGDEIRQAIADYQSGKMGFLE